jgi:hypothetical protein
MTGQLGKLERVDLRSIWTTEAQDFTPWLAREENLAELGKAIGLELELVGQEQYVGPYRADILCKDSLTQAYVLVENQLAKTDHGHLGQILTYAAGLGAKTVVWVAEKFTDEHRAALDWLNEITEEEYGFFALEIELWRIGASPAAPKFNIISKPNEWRKTVSDTAKVGGEMPERLQLYQRFWSAFRDFLLQRPGTPLRSQKPPPGHWTNFAIGRSGFVLVATASIEKQRLGAELWMSPRDIDPKEAFRRLEQQKADIHRDAGFEFEWQELPDAKGSRIASYLSNTPVENENDWPRQFIWLADHLEALDRALRKRVKLL